MRYKDCDLDDNFYVLWSRACARNPSEAIASRLREMSEVFLQSYEAKGEENKGLAKGLKLYHVTTILEKITIRIGAFIFNIKTPKY